jgi:hypothetical protein
MQDLFPIVYKYELWTPPSWILDCCLSLSLHVAVIGQNDRTPEMAALTTDRLFFMAVVCVHCTVQHLPRLVGPEGRVFGEH